MESNQQNWSPQQWEDHYLAQLQADVNQQSNYSTQITQNMAMGYYYGPMDQMNIVFQMKNYRLHLNDYDDTAKWFLERQLHRFSDFLNAVKLDMDKAINISGQTYQSTIKSDTANNNYLAQTQKEINDIYKTMNDNRIASFNKTNELWRKNF